MTAPAPAGELVVRLAGPDDAAGILEYYRKQLKAGARVADVMQWRETNASSGGNRPAIALLDGELAGIVNSVPATLTCGGRRVPTAWQGDSVVSPSLRGRGVGKQLVKAASPNAAIVLAKGTVPAMYALRKSVGFEDVGNAEFLLRGLGFRGATLKRRLRNGLLALAAAIRARRSAGVVREVSGFDAAFDELEQRLSQVDEVRIAKSAAYLSWRYGQVPGRRYRILRLDGERLRGAIVLRDAAEPGGDAWIVDFIVDPADGEAVSSLARAAVDAARISGAGALRAFATSPRVRAELFRAGFARTKETPRFTRWVRDPAAAELAHKAWHFSHGDGDIELY